MQPYTALVYTDEGTPHLDNDPSCAIVCDASKMDEIETCQDEIYCVHKVEILPMSAVEYNEQRYRTLLDKWMVANLKCHLSKVEYTVDP